MVISGKNQVCLENLLSSVFWFKENHHENENKTN